jgi:hypothetical protein
MHFQTQAMHFHNVRRCSAVLPRLWSHLAAVPHWALRPRQWSWGPTQQQCWHPSTSASGGSACWGLQAQQQVRLARGCYCQGVWTGGHGQGCCFCLRFDREGPSFGMQVPVCVSGHTCPVLRSDRLDWLCKARASFMSLIPTLGLKA